MSGPAVEKAAPAAPAYVWLFTAGLFFNMFSGVAATLGLPVSLDRPLLLLALLLLVLDPRTPALRARAVHGVMGALVVWTLFSWLSHGVITDSAKAFALVDRIAIPFAMFLAGPLVYSTPRRRDLLLRMLVLVGVYLGFTAIFEVSHLDALVFPRAIVDPSLGIGFGRARGPFLNAEAMGMTTTLTMVMGVVLAGRTQGAWRLASWTCSVVSAVAVVACLTRSSWLGAVLVLVLVVVTVPSTRRYVPGVLAAVAAVVAVVVSLAPAVVTGLNDRLETSRSLYDRLNTNAAAIRIIEAHPVAGIGWGNYLRLGTDWVRQADTYPLTNVGIEIHNVFLSRAAETGVIGAVLWGLAVLLGPLTVVLSRVRRTSEERAWQLLAASGLLVWLVPSMTSPNPYPLPNNLMWLLGGIAGVGLLVRERSVAEPAEVLA